MSLIEITEPIEEPVSLDEMQNFLRIDESRDDTLLRSLIKAARLVIEKKTQRILCQRSFRWLLDSTPNRYVAFQISPVTAVLGVSFLNKDGTWETGEAGSYSFVPGEPSHIKILTGANTYQKNMRVAIEFSAGDIALNSMHTDLIYATKALAGHYFMHKDQIDKKETSALPATIKSILSPYIPVRL